MRFIVLLFVFSCFNGKAQPYLMPSPKRLDLGKANHFITDGEIQILGLPDEQFINTYADILGKVTGLEISENSGFKIEVSFKDCEPKEVGYTLLVDEGKVLITCCRHEDAVNAFMTLLQLFEVNHGQVYLRECKIEDKPDFEWRGMHLDVCRHFYNVEEVKRMLDLMALYKMNVFHWHLTDDQGWRIEIEKYPLLHQVGGFRDSTLIGHYSDTPQEFDPRVYGGYYSKEEISEVIDYASSLGIMVVPEIEMPGHSRAALAAYPEYSCTGDSLPVPGTWGVFNDIYCSKEETINFLEDVLKEIIDLFPSPYLHIGGDEAPKERWKHCDKCQRVIKENDLKDEHQLQSYFIKRIDHFLTTQGKTLIGWDEILEGGLSENAIVMSWRGVGGGIDAVEQGHKTIMTPTTYCYFDYYQSNSGKEPIAIGGYLPLDKVYQFKEIYQNERIQENQDLFLGGQANLWTEYISGIDHLEYMAFPRLLALSENLWNKKSTDYLHFLQKLSGHLKILDSLDVNYSSAFKIPMIELQHIKGGIGIKLRGPDTNAIYQTRVSVGRSENKGYGFDDYQYPGELKFFQSNSSRLITLEIQGNFEDTRKLEMVTHKGLGERVQLITEPHPKYSNNGGLNLVDGVKGRRPWVGDEWLGFNEENVEFYFEFEEKKQVDTLIVGYMKEEGQWIYLPELLTVYISNNGKKWKKLSSHHGLEENFQVSIGVKTKYLKLSSSSIEHIPDGKQGAGNIPWTFIDEIEIR